MHMLDSMMDQVQRDMQSMQTDMMSMHREMHGNAQRAAAEARAQAQEGRTQALQHHREAMQQHRVAMQHAREMQRNARHVTVETRARVREQNASTHQARRDIARQSRGGLAGASFGSRASGMNVASISTAVVNGTVFVNGEEVAQAPRNGAVSVQVNDGVVHVNGVAVWPRGTGQQVLNSHSLSPPSACSIEAAHSHSAVGVCSRALAEPCAVCLEEIATGNQTRTLPCFHMLHRNCAEQHFLQCVNMGQDVLCPICRIPVVQDSG